MTHRGPVRICQIDNTNIREIQEFFKTRQLYRRRMVLRVRPKEGRGRALLKTAYAFTAGFLFFSQKRSTGLAMNIDE